MSRSYGTFISLWRDYDSTPQLMSFMSCMFNMHMLFCRSWRSENALSLPMGESFFFPYHVYTITKCLDDCCIYLCNAAYITGTLCYCWLFVL